jgi:hypothetical protein
MKGDPDSDIEASLRGRVVRLRGLIRVSMVHAAVEAATEAAMMDAAMKTPMPEATVAMKMVEAIREEDRASDE